MPHTRSQGKFLLAVPFGRDYLYSTADDTWYLFMSSVLPHREVICSPFVREYPLVILSANIGVAFDIDVHGLTVVPTIPPRCTLFSIKDLFCISCSIRQNIVPVPVAGLEV